MRTALALAALVAAAVPLTGTAAAGGIGLSASPARLRLDGPAGGSIAVRNPGARPLLVDVSRAGLARSLRGRARIRPPRDALTWLRVRPRRLRLAAHGSGVLRIVAAPPRGSSPGDHPALVLITTRPLGERHVRVRLRIGVVVVLHVPGRIVRRLDPRTLSLRRRHGRTLLELRLVNRGNVTEELGGAALRLELRRRGRVVALLRPRHLELLPHSAGIAEFPYRGRVHGSVSVRAVLPPKLRGKKVRIFRLRL